MNAAVFARKNQMDLAVSSVIGAATQIALLVAPALVFASLLLPEPMDLLFNRLELVALIISVFTARNMTIDGKSDWLEGAMLIAVFVMLGIGFYFSELTVRLASIGTLIAIGIRIADMLAAHCRWPVRSRLTWQETRDPSPDSFLTPHTSYFNIVSQMFQPATAVAEAILARKGLGPCLIIRSPGIDRGSV